MSNHTAPAASGISRDDLLLEEYRAYRDFVTRNEAAGETRVNLFLTVNSALVAILALGGGALLAAPDGPGGVVLILLIGALLLVGRTVLVRTVRRNLITTHVLHHVECIRGELARGHPDVEPLLAWKSGHAGAARRLPRRQRDLLRFRSFLVPAKGGLVEMVALLNSFLCGALAGAIALRAPAALPSMRGAEPALLLGAAAVAGFLAGWAWHVREINGQYLAARAGEEPETTTIAAVADALRVEVGTGR